MPNVRSIVITSNMKNEESQLSKPDSWIDNMKQITDQIIVVLGNSKDNSEEILKSNDIIVVNSNIITEEGYGPARNHLREMARKFYPDSKWCCYFDADERILGKDIHHLRHIAEDLVDDFDVVAFPRIDWCDRGMTKAQKDYHVFPDWQARMTRLNSNLKYVRRLHEQVVDFKAIYAELTNPKINHYHRNVEQAKRDYVGRLCSKLHAEDEEYGSSYPKHHKEDMYYEQYLKEGLD